MGAGERIRAELVVAWGTVPGCREQDILGLRPPDMGVVVPLHMAGPDRVPSAWVVHHKLVCRRTRPEAAWADTVGTDLPERQAAEDIVWLPL